MQYRLPSPLILTNNTHEKILALDCSVENNNMSADIRLKVY